MRSVIRDAPPYRRLVDRKTPRRLGDGREPGQREDRRRSSQAIGCIFAA
jgi:hypothetical protein